MSISIVDHCFEFALKLVKSAGRIIAEVEDKKYESKEEAWDFVTEYDRKVEDILVKELKEKFPTHKFIGEEASSSTKTIPDLTNDPTWIIDPIDGTNNFVHNFPYYGISVGLYINKEAVIGIVYNPVLEELFTAKVGHGAYRNGKRIKTSQLEDITKAVVIHELSLGRLDEWRDVYSGRLHELLHVVPSIRSLGSAALSLCYIASGASDVYNVDGLYPWDSAAGALIVKEAGGFICHTDGSKFDVMKSNFVAASSEKLAKGIVELFRKADDKLSKQK